MAYLVTVTEGLSSMEPLTQGHFFNLQTWITAITKITATTTAMKDTSTPTTIAVTSSDSPEGKGLVAKSERIKINHKLDYNAYHYMLH